MLEGASASDGPLTVAQAVEVLSTPEKTVEQPNKADPAPAEEVEETEIPADTTAEGASEAETPGDDVATEGEEEAAAIQLEPPKWWNNERKARFKELPPDLQAVVFEQEETRERVVAKAKQEASEARKQADEDKSKLSQRIAVLDHVVPQAIQMFQSRWANVDWTAAAEQLAPEDYQKARAQFEKEQETVRTLAAEKQKTDEENTRAFVKAEFEKLRDVAPDLVDQTPDKETKTPLGDIRRKQIGSFLTDLGFPAERIIAMTAHEASLAYDAMRWRKAQASAKAMAKPKAAPTPAATVRPTAAPATGNTETAKVREAQARFEREPSIQNAVALENARKLAK